ncbi:hypothetical protein [Pseudarthrobacter sp. S6]|uniref:hypothetical protein n=1 Tax=Pseudarthrobacter sp. S6 TaxID=3418420 RepID=UPI003CE8F3AB
MKITAEPRSDQWNADDFLGGPRTFTIAAVKDGAAEQKYDIALEGEARAWRPPLGMLRVLMQAWGDESNVWTGRRVTLFRDQAVRFGKEVPGGIRISHLSHIDKAVNFKVTTSRGKRETYTVQPLKEAPKPTTPQPPIEPVDWLAHAEQAKGDVPRLQKIYADAEANGADATILTAIRSLA